MFWSPLYCLVQVVNLDMNGLEEKWKLERKWQDAYFSENFNYIEHSGDDYKIAFFGLRYYPREKLAQWLREGLVSYEDIHEGITLPEENGNIVII